MTRTHTRRGVYSLSIIAMTVSLILASSGCVETRDPVSGDGYDNTAEDQAQRICDMPSSEC